MPKSKRDRPGPPPSLSLFFFYYTLPFYAALFGIPFIQSINSIYLCVKNAVTLSKTRKKGREHKEAVVNAIREAAETYSWAYVFSFENMRNLKFKEFRDQLKSSSRY
jgi:hypothetical protein